MPASPSPLVDPGALRTAFAARFGATAKIARAPGRINLIGEHTDYSGGRVLPAAIDRACLLAYAPSPDGRLHLDAGDVGETRVLDDDAEAPTWARYLAAPRMILAREGLNVPPAMLMARGDVPMGLGMSSSAALLVAGVLAALDLAGQSRTPMEVARLAQRAETDVIGVPCGLMDQFASTHGRAGHALWFDCFSFEWRAIPAPAQARFVVVDSGVRHALTDGGYAQRRAECERAATKLGVALLREARMEMLEPALADDPVALRRARHVVTENARVDAAVGALEAGDLATLGALMNASHASLRDDFAVTCPETDALAQALRAVPGIYGARQMGGGFGGGVLALVDAAQVESVMGAIVGLSNSTPVLCRLDGGAELIA